jgi:hypothetical protein
VTNQTNLSRYIKYSFIVYKDKNLLHDIYFFNLICSLFYDAFTVTTTFCVEWLVDKWMIHCKEFGRKCSWPNFKILFLHSSGRAEENNERPQSGWLVSGPRFETGIPRIRSRSFSEHIDDVSLLLTKTVFFSETSVFAYKSIQLHNAEQQHRCQNVKSHKTYDDLVTFNDITFIPRLVNTDG